jgi:hypothetical protein
VHTKPNKKYCDDKYIMGTYEIKKNNSSKEALIVDGTMKITRYPNFFT